MVSAYRIDGDRSSVREARWMVRSLAGQCDPELCDPAELVTGELVTNAVIHGGGRFRLSALATEQSLTVIVADERSTPPTIRDGLPQDPGGRGMKIVDLMSTAWGSQPIEAGKEVWFTMAPPVARAPRTR